MNGPAMHQQPPPAGQPLPPQGFMGGPQPMGILGAPQGTHQPANRGYPLNIQQQQVLDRPPEDPPLNCGPHGHDLIGVDPPAGLLAEQIFHYAVHLGR